MKISGSYTLPVARERAYQMLQDPEVLAKCMPGTDRLEKIGDDEYEMKMKMVIASFSGLFSGKVRIAEPNFPQHFQLIVEGNGKVGSGRMEILDAPTRSRPNSSGCWWKDRARSAS